MATMKPTGLRVRLTVLPLVMVEMVIMCQPPSRGALIVLRSLLEPTTPSACLRKRVTQMAHFRQMLWLHRLSCP